MTRQIKRVNGKLRAGTVTSVIVPSPHDPNLRLEMTSKVDMEEVALQRMNDASTKQLTLRICSLSSTTCSAP
jgi:hypothetical protein